MSKLRPRNDDLLKIIAKVTGRSKSFRDLFSACSRSEFVWCGKVLCIKLADFREISQQLLELLQFILFRLTSFCGKLSFWKSGPLQKHFSLWKLIFIRHARSVLLVLHSWLRSLRVSHLRASWSVWFIKSILLPSNEWRKRNKLVGCWMQLHTSVFKYPLRHTHNFTCLVKISTKAGVYAALESQGNLGCNRMAKNCFVEKRYTLTMLRKEQNL